MTYVASVVFKLFCYFESSMSESVKITLLEPVLNFRQGTVNRNILDSGGYYETVTYSAHEMEYSRVWTDQRISRE